MAGEFTTDRRERLLTLLETGRNMEEACAAVDVSRATVTKWAARGREEDGTDAASFAERLDAIREGVGAERLAEEDLVRLLEVQARKGSVRAAELLLRRIDAAGGEPPDDPFARFIYRG